MQPGPGSAFEVIEAEFLLELLMRLFTDPSGFDRGGEFRQARIGWQVRHIVFLFARRPAFADEPDLVARHALHTIVDHAVLMAGLFSSLILMAALGFPRARMCESMSDNQNRRLSDARVAIGDFARNS